MSVRKYTSRPRSWAYSHIGPNASCIACARATWSSPAPYTSCRRRRSSKVRYSMKPGTRRVAPSASDVVHVLVESTRAEARAASSTYGASARMASSKAMSCASSRCPRRTPPRRPRRRRRRGRPCGTRAARSTGSPRCSVSFARREPPRRDRRGRAAAPASDVASTLRASTEPWTVYNWSIAGPLREVTPSRVAVPAVSAAPATASVPVRRRRARGAVSAALSRGESGGARPRPRCRRRSTSRRERRRPRCGSRVRP